MSEAVVKAEKAINRKIEEIERDFLTLPQVDVPLQHFFAPHVYGRVVKMSAGTRVIGHEHKTKHLNFVMTGRANVFIDGQCYEVKAPCIFVSEPGVRKVLEILEDMVWATTHPTDETNLDKLEEELIVKSDAFLAHQALQTSERPSLKTSEKTGEQSCLG